MTNFEKARDEAAEKCPATPNNVAMIVGFKAGADWAKAFMQAEVDQLRAELAKRENDTRAGIKASESSEFIPERVQDQPAKCEKCGNAWKGVTHDCKPAPAEGAREWWVQCGVALKCQPREPESAIHVIEKSAYDAIKAELDARDRLIEIRRKYVVELADDRDRWREMCEQLEVDLVLRDHMRSTSAEGVRYREMCEKLADILGIWINYADDAYAPTPMKMSREALAEYERMKS